jgi:hypothetical protein
MQKSILFEDIRPVIEAMSDLICCHGMAIEDDGVIREQLLAMGFDLSLVRAAEDWCDGAQATGSIMDVLSTFAPSGEGTRVYSPLERVAVSDDVWKVIESCRKKGLITLDTAERMLEGARAMDTRDWDDDDVLAFLADAHNSNHTPVNHSIIEKAFLGVLRNYHS